MEKYTKEQKLEVAKFFEEGFSAREIFEVTNIPVGTLYRWKHEAKASDPKAQQVDTITQSEEVLQLRAEVDTITQSEKVLQARVAQLEAQITQLAQLEDELAEISSWVARKKKSEAKERGYSENTSTFQFKRAGPM